MIQGLRNRSLLLLAGLSLFLGPLLIGCKEKTTLQWVHINDALGKRWIYTKRWYYCGKLKKTRRWTTGVVVKGFLGNPQVSGRASYLGVEIPVFQDPDVSALLNSHPVFSSFLEDGDQWVAFTTVDPIEEVSFDLVNSYDFEFEILADEGSPEPPFFTSYTITSDDPQGLSTIFLTQNDFNEEDGTVKELVLQDDFSIFGNGDPIRPNLRSDRF